VFCRTVHVARFTLQPRPPVWPAAATAMGQTLEKGVNGIVADAIAHETHCTPS